MRRAESRIGVLGCSKHRGQAICGIVAKHRCCVCWYTENRLRWVGSGPSKDAGRLTRLTEDRGVRRGGAESGRSLGSVLGL